MKWEPSLNNPIIDGDVLFGAGYRTEDSKVVKVGNKYYMGISSGKDGDSMDIYMLEADFLSGPWRKTQKEPIVSRGRFCDFDYKYLRLGSIIFHKGIGYLYYSGQNLLRHDAIGVATTSEADFPFGWKKYKGNPILKSMGNNWESWGILTLCMKRMQFNGKEWYGHYTGEGKDRKYHLGICYGNSPYGPFIRYSANPILGPGKWDIRGPARADFIQTENEIFGVYETFKYPFFYVGGYRGSSAEGPFVKIFPDKPIISELKFNLQFANPCLWEENGKTYLFAGRKAITDITAWWRYIDLFTLIRE